MSAATIFLLLVIAVAVFLGYDYYKNKEGPKTWWRFWVSETPAVAPAAPAAATPTEASAAGPAGVVTAKTVSAASSSPTTSSTMGAPITTTAKTA
ncbi:hypothetical protein EBT31_01240 [bacterium]|nr:hypothetical protein [bacterium]NBX48947.1 hypothetical protein [bacterium]